MEIIVAEAVAGQIEEKLSGVAGARVTPTPGGARIEVPNEADVDEALRAVRSTNARLVSIQPVGNALEELFVGEKPPDNQLV